MLGIEPEAAGWEASILPMCYAAQNFNHHNRHRDDHSLEPAERVLLFQQNVNAA